MFACGTPSKVFVHLLRAGIAMAAMLGIAAPTQAAIFTYQGVLKSAGSPINGAVDLKFRLYANSAGAGIPIGNLAINGVVVTDGLLKVDLDFGPSAFNGTDRWLAIEVASPAAGGGGPFTLLTPLQQVSFAPMAQFALNASLSGSYANAVNFTNAANIFAGSGAGLTSLNASSLASGTVGSTLLNGTYSNALTLSNVSNVFNGSGAGLTSVNANLLDGLDSTAFLQAVPLPLTLSGSAPTHIIRGTNSSATAGSSGVYGAVSAATGVTYGLYGTSASTSGRGVIGWATATTGNTYGLWGNNDSTSGRGVYGSASTTTGATSGVHGESASTTGRGVSGEATAATGTTYGGHFLSDSTSGRGVYASAEAASGFNYGVYGASNSTSGRGVFGWTNAASGSSYGGEFRSDSTDGRGVFGWTSAPAGDTSGGYFWSASTSGRGVYGYASAASGTTNGVYGASDSTSGRGVFGYATDVTGDNFGVYGRSDSTQGQGVFGFAQAASGTNFGVYGLSNSPDGRGVNGYASALSGFAYGVRGESASSSGFGVYGIATASGPNTYGVRGSNTSSGYGVYSLGNMGASGSKPFRIDHPDDPANKYLLHYAAESPEVINFYRGKVVLNGAGEAIVDLPHYFAKINKDPSYQLTAVGAAMPNLHVAVEIDEGALIAGARAEPNEAAEPCWFRIAGGAPGAKVSWEVKAVRNDRFIQQHGAPVEVDKQSLERGKYQHPDLYDQPAEMGMDYRTVERGEMADAQQPR